MKRILSIILAVCACIAAQAQVAKVQALYLFQFAKNTSWAAEDMGKDFVITIIGDKSVASELKTAVNNKTVGNRKVVVNEIGNLSKLTQSDIIFLGDSKKSLIDQLVESQANNKVLIVSATEGHCSNGAGIAFMIENDKLGFEINEGNLSKKGLKVTPKLAMRGKQVF